MSRNTRIACKNIEATFKLEKYQAYEDMTSLSKLMLRVRTKHNNNFYWISMTQTTPFHCHEKFSSWIRWQTPPHSPQFSPSPMLHPNISMHILNTFLFTFLIRLTRRICVTIWNIFSWWSFPLLSWPLRLFLGGYCKENLDASHS